MGLFLVGAVVADFASTKLGLRSDSSRADDSANGVDDDGVRGVVLELLVGRSTFIGRVAAGREYVDVVLVGSVWLVAVDRHELPHTPGFDFDTGVE